EQRRHRRLPATVPAKDHVELRERVKVTRPNKIAEYAVADLVEARQLHATSALPSVKPPSTTEQRSLFVACNCLLPNSDTNNIAHRILTHRVPASCPIELFDNSSDKFRWFDGSRMWPPLKNPRNEWFEVRDC